ncbi:hypothetical protein INR49_032762, partial [Caranx melampygus]
YQVRSELMDDLFSGLGSSCVVAGRRGGDHPHSVLYSVVFKCLEPDSLYKFTLNAVDSRGGHSESSFVSVRTSCPMVDDSRAEEIADKVYNLYNGYTSGKEQQMAYNTLMEIPPPLLYRVQHHYNSHYEKFGDFVWRSEDELGPRKANLILRRVEKISHYCRSLLRSTHIQSRTDTMAYVYCLLSEEGRPPIKTWHSSLHESRTTCMEKLISGQLDPGRPAQAYLTVTDEAVCRGVGRWRSFCDVEAEAFQLVGVAVWME